MIFWQIIKLPEKAIKIESERKKREETVDNIIITLLPMLFALLGTAVTLHFLIPVLKSKKMGQKILDIGPRWHKDKEGTPTMGGIAFLIFVALSSLSVTVFLFFTEKITKGELYGILFTVVYALLNGLIGITDDARKLKRKQNEGLTAKEKYLLQLSVSLIYIVALVMFKVVDTTLYIPFWGKNIQLSYFWYLFAILFLTGFGNAVNLTDGIDGLCGAVSGAVAVFFIAYTLRGGNIGGTVLSSALFGGCIGFLVYNLHPAKIFMGDTGSLFLGALISGMTLMLGDPIILFFVGLIYFLEAASVIIQVLGFKLTGKRVFLMAPLHHHFEKRGLSEGRITFLSVAVTVLVSIGVYYLTK